MIFTPQRLGVLICVFILLGLGSAGCGKPEPPRAAKDKHASTHGEWWCDEHGIPEEECSMCSKKLAQECKKKGDWCEEHNRAKSQCFFCDPSLREKYAEKYRAKYGKEPPPIPELDKKSEGGKG